FGLFSKKTTKTSVWVSFVTGVGLTMAHMILFGLGLFPELAKSAASLPLNLASPINAGAISMILSIVIVPVVSIFTGKPKADYVEDVFECYNEK
ncbi:MAG: sodium:solute symporter, partial [Oscillospiraceae bacterium]|nr:sodium:solute symporter [Oscillospiraceae bacterium]